MAARPSWVGSIEQPISGVGLPPRRERPQGHDQVLQLHHRPPAGQAHHAAGRIGHPAFGRAGQHDVLAVGIEEHVADPQQSGQVAHLVGQRALVVDDGLLQPVERDLSQFAEGGDFGSRVALAAAIRSRISCPPGSLKTLVRSTPSASTATPAATLVGWWYVGVVAGASGLCHKPSTAAADEQPQPANSHIDQSPSPR